MNATVRTLDTNILVRLFAQDDERQTRIAVDLLSEPHLLLPSVLIELVWVLKSRYTFDHPRIAAQLRAILGSDQAVVVSPNAVSWALDRFEAGADFADMLHYALAEELEAMSFATFDKRIKPHQVEGSAVSLERLG
jgi:predicted nucleic-acid-binding protein